MVTRSELTPEELAAPQRVHFALKMRNFEELRARIARGELLSVKEMKARYFPSPDSWRAIATWASSHGYAVEAESGDPSHLTVFTTSTVANVQTSLRIRFARVVGTDGNEYTSAVQPPVFPSEIVDLVVGVSQIHPHLRPRSAQAGPPQIFQAGRYGPALAPQSLAQLYNASGLISSGRTLDGSGQTIIVLGFSKVNPADLATFWTKCGLSTTSAQFTEVDPTPLNLQDNVKAVEETCDIEWASAMAPKAKILYISNLDLSLVTKILLTQFAGDQTIHQLSESYGVNENDFQAGHSLADDQYWVALAAMGITNFAPTGDAGSNSTDYPGYDANACLTTSYPACDSYVTAVGGTAVGYAYSSDYTTFSLPVTEGGWCLPDPPHLSPPSTLLPANYHSDASTGGFSLYYPRPSWQACVGGVNRSIPILASGNMRCVPDVAAMATGAPLAYAYFYGGDVVFNGTSQSSPVWAGLCALINQARANAGIPPLGLLGPHVYPLMGTSAFNQMTVGSQGGSTGFTATSNNGAYGTGVNYNLVTGLGSPNIGNLVLALATPPASVRQVSLSTRAQVASGDGVAIVGFASNGPSSLTKQFLLRAVGPTLSNFGVPGTLAQPVLTLFDNKSQIVATNTGWGNAPVASASATSGAQAAQGIAVRRASPADMASVQAFALPADANGAPASADSAMVAVLPPGAYTLQVSGGAGVALAEVYEMSSEDPMLLTSLSSRTYVGTGANASFAGLSSSGSKNGQFLIRAVGPALGTFGVTGTLAQPVLTIFDGKSQPIASNAGWKNAPTKGNSPVVATVRAATAADMTAVGAFGLPTGSADSALVITLPPGLYTAQVAGANDTTGVALVESYQMSASQ